ncbi:MAG: hypothetical protein KC413_17155 [Anaerolineales bacterium]|nr:hypothetical protein [Anaerolineales bacterium]
MSNYDQILFVDREKKVRGFQKLLEPTTRQAVMLIEAPRDMGKTWLLSKMQHHCQEQTARIPVAIIDFRNPREIHEIQDMLGLIRLLRRKLGDTPHFNDLNATINSVTSSPVAAGQGTDAQRGTLRQMMEQAFSLDDIQSITFDLKFDYENLSGTTKTAKIRALIQTSERLQRLADLITICRQMRPNLDWSQAEQEVGEGETAVSTPNDTRVPDQNGQIWADTEMERRRAERLINDAFFACLETIMQETRQIVLLFDSMEEAPDTAEQWIRNELLLRLRDGQIQEAVIIITGRKTPDLTDLDIKHLTVQTDLEPFTEEHVREYFEERRKLSGLDIRTIVLTSGGVPGALAMMADRATTTRQDDDDFFSDL